MVIEAPQGVEPTFIDATDPSAGSMVNTNPRARNRPRAGQQPIEVENRHLNTLYNGETGRMVKVTRRLMEEALALESAGGKNMLLPTGEMLWNIRPPKKTMRNAGLGLLCYLYPDHPGANEYLSRGFPPCARDSLANEYKLQIHVERRHKRLGGYIAQKLVDEQNESRRLMDQTMKRLAEQSAQNAPPPPPPPAPEEEHWCEHCDFVSKTKNGLRSHQRGSKCLGNTPPPNDPPPPQE